MRRPRNPPYIPDCDNDLHGHPLPYGYAAASEQAESRLQAGWRNLRCPDCGIYGWKPPKEAQRA